MDQDQQRIGKCYRRQVETDAEKESAENGTGSSFLEIGIIGQQKGKPAHLVQKEQHQ